MTRGNLDRHVGPGCSRDHCGIHDHEQERKNENEIKSDYLIGWVLSEKAKNPAEAGMWSEKMRIKIGVRPLKMKANQWLKGKWWPDVVLHANMFVRRAGAIALARHRIEPPMPFTTPIGILAVLMKSTFVDTYNNVPIEALIIEKNCFFFFFEIRSLNELGKEDKRVNTNADDTPEDKG